MEWITEIILTLVILGQWSINLKYRNEIDTAFRIFEDNKLEVKKPDLSYTTEQSLKEMTEAIKKSGSATRVWSNTKENASGTKSKKS